MVTITNITSKNLRRRDSTGNVVTICAGETVELKGRHWENPALLEQFKSYAFKVTKGKGTPKVGGGIKTHVKPSKPRGRPPKQAKKEEVKPKSKKPKGLKKPKKRAD
tara:strand:- start:389 stop:709 length:321 start_codon:yes stop_codon:yes gene_type:complete